MIEYGKFQMSLKRLEEQYENYRTLDTSLPHLTQEATVNSNIQSSLAVSPFPASQAMTYPRHLEGHVEAIRPEGVNHP